MNKTLFVIGCLALALVALVGAGTMFVAGQEHPVPCTPGYPGCGTGGSASFCTPGYPGCNPGP